MQDDIRQLLKHGEAHLNECGLPNARRNAEWMLCASLECSVLELYTKSTDGVADDAARAYRHMIERRGRREPLQYILGSTEFMSLTFEVGSGVFVPRPETEALVEQSEQLLREMPLHSPLSVLDLCCGSGTVGVSLAARIPDAQVIAIDLQKPAVTMTIRNARRNGVSRRVRVLRDDAVAFLEDPPAIDAPERYSAIVCNPPYIETGLLSALPREVRDHEPMEALDGGLDGLDVYRRVSPHLSRRLEAHGFVAFEVGDTQGEAVRTIFEQAGLASGRIVKDYAGKDRIVVARAREHRG